MKFNKQGFWNGFLISTPGLLIASIKKGDVGTELFAGPIIGIFFGIISAILWRQKPKDETQIEPPLF